MPDDETQEAKRNTSVARQMLKAWNERGETHMVDALMSPSLVTRFSAPITAAAGRERKPVESEVALPREGVQNQRFEEEIVITEGDRVFVAWSVTGKNNGQLYGRAPTGKDITVHGADVMRVHGDGKIAEHWDFYSKARVHALARLGLLDEDMQQMLVRQGLLGRGHPSGVVR